MVVDLPKDVLQAKGGHYLAPGEVKHQSYRPRLKTDKKTIQEAVEMIAQAKRPLIYAGGGVINSGDRASTLLTRFVRTLGAPCTNTLMGLGGFPASDPLFLGMLGMHGTYEANLAMYHCDLMIAVGARFDDRVTGRLNEFAPHSRKIHIDIDPSSINKTVVVDLPIVGDVGHVLGALDRQGRRGPGDLGTGRDEHRDRADRCADGFDPGGLPDRPGADPSDRQRRLPGGGHHRHHPALHQAQLPGEVDRECLPDHSRGLLCRA